MRKSIFFFFQIINNQQRKTTEIRQKLLNSTKLPSANPTPNVEKDGHSNSETCINLVEDAMNKFKSRQTFLVKKYLTCSSKNLIYVTKCKGYNKDYIGQSKLTLGNRMAIHRQQIHDPTGQIAFGEHLDLCTTNNSLKF